MPPRTTRRTAAAAAAAAAAAVAAAATAAMAVDMESAGDSEGRDVKDEDEAEASRGEDSESVCHPAYYPIQCFTFLLGRRR